MEQRGSIQSVTSGHLLIEIRHSIKPLDCDSVDQVSKPTACRELEKGICREYSLQRSYHLDSIVSSTETGNYHAAQQRGLALLLSKEPEKAGLSESGEP